MANYSIISDNLKLSYRKKEALKGLNFSLNENQIIGLIGANGSGKTTFFNVCAGNLSPKSGSVTILGGNATKDISIKEEVIYSMHNLPVGDNFKLKNVVEFYNITYPHFDKEFALKLLNIFSLPINKKVSSLSQGMKSLFHLSCAIAARAKVTLLDEPFIGIDIERRKLSYEVLLRDFMEHPRTIVISSHNLSEIENLLSEIVLINEGETIFYKDIDSVRELLFRADGDNIDDYSKNENVLITKKGELGNYLICHGSVNSEFAKKLADTGFKISPVSPEDTCVYYTTYDKERDLECLWN